MSAETGEPTDNIHQDVIDMLAAVGATRYTTTSELLDAEDEGVSQAIVEGITKYNQERAASYNQKVGGWSLPLTCVCVCYLLSTCSPLCSTLKILKFHLLEIDFSVHGGELGRNAAAHSTLGRDSITALLSSPLYHSDADSKPQRAAILKKYTEEIEQLYAE